MIFSRRGFVLVGVVGLLTTRAFARPDYYTSGFYTRGVDTASHIDKGGPMDPFYLPLQAWVFLPRVTLTASQDDNFFMTPEAQQPQLGVYLIPGAMLIYGRPEHNHLYIDTGISLPIYQSLSTANSGRSYMITAGGLYKTGRSQLSGRVGHRRTETADVVVGERVVDQDMVGDLNLEHRISPKTSLGLSGSVEVHEFGNPGYINYNRYYGSGRVARPMTDKSEWFVQGGLGLDDLAKAQPGTYGDASFYDLSAGVRGKPSPKTTASGRLGYRWRTYDDAAIAPVEHWIANLGLEVNPFGLSTFTAECVADIRPDVTGLGDSTVDERLTLGVNRRLFTESLQGDASVFFGRTDHNRPTGTSQDQYWGFNLGIDWWSRKNLSFGAAYSYTERWNVSGGGSSYESGIWSVRMSWNY